MLRTIRDLYEESLRYEQIALAYYIYGSLQEGLVKLEDDEQVLFQTQVDQRKIGELIERNPLGFNDMKVFALKVKPNKFLFVFAESQKEAIEFVQKEQNINPLNCHKYSLDFPMSRGNQFVSFREMKKEFSAFPALIGIYEREIY